MTTSQQRNSNRSIIIFDGECNLCNGIIGWLLKMARKKIFHFIPFQSPEGQELLKKNNRTTDRLDTVIVIDDDGLFTHSDGFLRILNKLPKWKRAGAWLSYIPRTVRDTIYKTASRNRVKWFGASAMCTVDFR